jgi:protein-S-isoprenylcysteine O-methyltransferase Ste14
MDPINILVALNLFVSTSANYSGARKGFKTSITKVVDRPVSFLQKAPPNISALILIVIIFGVFDAGTLQSAYGNLFISYRIVGLILFILFSWVQVWSYKSLGKNYAQDVVILKDHALYTRGIYGVVRHPQYLSQILSDFGAALALLSYIALPLVLLVELPLFVMRASFEDKMLSKHFGGEFLNYKKRSGFMIPFIG